MPVVTLLSDFGLKDSYVSQMKGIILATCPDSIIVDITHMVPRHDIVSGAFLLETAVPFFPEKSVHLAIVDPGVGTARLPVVVESRKATLVGPDNGLLERAAKRLGVRGVYKIDANRLRLGHVSNTFHGRDIFAKTVGRLATGLRAKDVGPPVKGLVKLRIPEARVNRLSLECRILYIDTFGNIVTNADTFLLRRLSSHARQVIVRSSSRTRRAQIARTYSDAGQGEFVILEGSQGYVEVAAREADAGKKLQVRTGESLEILIARQGSCR